MSPREEVQAIQADTARIREVREELEAMNASDRGDCDSALDPDEDNSGLEPAEEDDEDPMDGGDPNADYDLETKYREDE